jgi:hypothetical protein
LAGQLLKKENIPSNWTMIAAKMYLPVVTNVNPAGAIHLQDKQYTYGKQINQAAVGLLQYPLEVGGFSKELKRNDLLYYEAVTKSNGPVRVFRQKFTLEDAIGSHACSLEALTCV